MLHSYFLLIYAQLFPNFRTKQPDVNEVVGRRIFGILISIFLYVCGATLMQLQRIIYRSKLLYTL
jgi:hypothetical protein